MDILQMTSRKVYSQYRMNMRCCRLAICKGQI